APVTGREVERAAAEARTRGREVVLAPTAPPPVPAGPMDPEALGVTRRQFLNRGIVNMMLVSLGGFGAACLGFLWPGGGGGFGGKIKVPDSLDDIFATIDAEGRYYYAPGRFYIQRYPKAALSKAEKVYSGGVLTGMESGIVVLYQRCVHLGCRVPWCDTSKWFECPCHGSQYNRVGEKKGGPAPRGLDHFPVTVDGGNVVVDTGQIIPGPPIGTNTTGQEAEGPHCIGAGGGH
ncbi:MAG: Rieske 2Fe-2S domain-containing protein, partial [Actinomycetota bacterium]|nr:Rieske 2Fe-2S domain-containing protein [Actinomycetota bacterium]